MNKILLALSVLALPCAAYAQTLDLQTVSRIRQNALLNSDRMEARPKALLGRLASGRFDKKSLLDFSTATRADVDAPSVELALITLNEGRTADDLRADGIEVVTQIGNVVIAQVEVKEAEKVSAHPAIRSFGFERKRRTHMDKARESQNIDAIHFNKPQAGLSQAYTGKGVIAALVDQGFDPHHVNFRFDDKGSRVGYLAWLRVNAAGTGVAEDHYNYSNISNFRTDDAYGYHATHTTGIMAGSYNGPVTVAKPLGEAFGTTDPTYITKTNPYYGVAPEADIAVSCGDLQDGFIAYGMEYLVNYSEWEDRPWPMVLNLSLGSNSGPHDPNSAMSQIMDELGKKCIICVSAGNEGDLKIGLSKTFTEQDTQVKTMIYPYYAQYDPEVPNSQTIRYGNVEVWSQDSTPFQLQAVLYNKKRDYRAAKIMPVLGDGIGTYYITDSSLQMTETDVLGDPTFLKAYSSGYVGVGSKIDEETGRYYGVIDYYVINNRLNNLNDDYVLGFEVVGNPGQRIDCYCDGLTTWMDNYGVEGFTDGSMNGSISDMAVAHNIIAVGSYNTRREWDCLDGGSSHYEGAAFNVDDISGFSSFGTMPDGRNLPLVCAPGAAIISSLSWPYCKNLPEEQLMFECSAMLDEDNTDAVGMLGGRINYWKQEVGTSMASPFVAGSICLWLEANPDLTIDDVKEIIAKTSVKDDKVLAGDPVRWGAGKFNALEGLKEAIRMAGVDGITADGHNDRLMLTPLGNGQLNVFLGEASELNVAVYSIDGRLVASHHAYGDETQINTASLKGGVYIVNVNGRHSQKINLR